MHRLQWMRAAHQRGWVQSLHHRRFESWGLAVVRPGTQGHRPTPLQSLRRAGESLNPILPFGPILRLSAPSQMPSAILEHSLSLVGLDLELPEAPSTARWPRLLRLMCRQAGINAVRCRALAARDARHSPGVLYRSSVDTAAETRALVRKNSTALRDCNCLCSTGSIQLAEYRFDVGFDGSLCQCQFHRDPLITQ